MKARSLVGAAMASVCLAGGCQKFLPVRDQLTLLSLQGRSNNQTKNGVTVTVIPLDARNFTAQARDFTFPMVLPLCRPEGAGIAVGIGRRADGPKGVLRNDIFEPCCSFKLLLKNGTEHTLNLGNAVIQLEDGAGKSYDLLQAGKTWPSANKLLHDLVARHRFREANELKRVATQSIPIPKADDKILPGKTREFLLPFNANAAQPPLKVMVYDLITATDKAGNVASKDKFEFGVSVRKTELWRTKNPATREIEWSEVEPTTQCR